MFSRIDQNGFADAFRAFGRQDTFSRPGRRALFDYLEQMEEDTGEQIELDIIALCCDYSEYENALEAAKEYGFQDEVEDDEAEEKALEWLEERTTVICFDSGVIVASF